MMHIKDSNRTKMKHLEYSVILNDKSNFLRSLNRFIELDIYLLNKKKKTKQTYQKTERKIEYRWFSPDTLALYHQ